MLDSDYIYDWQSFPSLLFAVSISCEFGLYCLESEILLWLTLTLIKLFESLISASIALSNKLFKLD